jgi:GT2 family glycosyltransferase
MNKIKFSIIVPIAPERKAEILKSLNELDYNKDEYEIIVEKGTNASENRNKGIKKAQGEIIAFIDDDALLDKNWLKIAEKFFMDYPDIDIVGGPQLTPENDSIFGKCTGYALSSFLGGAIIRDRYKKSKINLAADERDLTSANMFCKKKIFENTLFNPEFWPGEDPTFFNECIETGLKLVYSPDIIIYHKRRGTLNRLAKQIFNYGYVRPKIKKIKKTEKASILFAIPSIFLLYIILFPMLYNINKFLIIPLYIYLILVLFLSIVGAIKEKNIFGILLIPIIFITIHLSYGLGYLLSYSTKKQ